MRANHLRTIWAEGGTAVNGWLHIPASWSAELMAHAGWDSLTIDLQHGLTDYQTAVTMFLFFLVFFFLGSKMRQTKWK